MEKGKQMMIADDEEPKPSVVFFDKNILKSDHLSSCFSPKKRVEEKKMMEKGKNLGRFLKYVEESPFMDVPWMKQVYDDLSLIREFLVDPGMKPVHEYILFFHASGLNLPQQFVGYDLLKQEINYLVHWVLVIISKKYDLEDIIARMRAPRDTIPKKYGLQDMVIGLFERLEFIIKLMPYWMDLIRKFYGKEPKSSLVDYFLPNLAALDALVHYLERSPLKLPWWEDVLLLRAILMDPPRKFTEDGSLKKFESIARELASMMSFIDLKNIDQDMAHEMHERLHHILYVQGDLSSSFESVRNEIRQIYLERPKPLEMYYQKIGQLGFLEHLLGNLGDLLVKAKADDSIRPLELDILRFLQSLQDVTCLLVEIPEPRKEEADVKDVITNITNLAYEAEYVIDSFLVRDIPICYCMLCFRDILRKLKHQRSLIKSAKGDAESILSIIRNMSSNTLEIIPIFIFNNNTEIGDTLGKVFNAVSKWGSFVCTRSSVSSYKERKKEVFLELLRNASIGENIERIEIVCSCYMNEVELEQATYNLLNGKRYVIILEDVPDIYALNDIKRVLPNDSSRRQVALVTTSNSELVVQCRYGFDMRSEHHTSTSAPNKPALEHDVVGFVKETESILEWLIRGTKKLRIISIIGAPGQGKTTLANKLFSDPLVVQYFDTRAWCYVSQVYEKRQLLLELLSQVVQLSKTDLDKDNAELAEMLYKHFKGRRFLIFLDDVWRIEAWNDLAICFPNDNNGSRIIFTTRIQGLASQAKSDSIVQPLSLLSDDESWKLLEKKLFQKESCPPELLEVGMQIARSCKGLPLSVVLTAGLLKKMEKRVTQWEQIAKSLSSLIVNDAEAQGKGIIELSYKHLPDHLKLCFLYFGAFLQDREILISKLIGLWIAEGFVKHIDLRSIEDVAEDYFRELIGRSLVTVVQEKSSGGIKSCRLHDLLREFALTKAREENVLQKIDGYDMDPTDSSSSIAINCHLRRLCIFPKRNHFTVLKPSGPFVRSLLFFAASDMNPKYLDDISFIFHNFKFLKVLNLEDINIGDSFKLITALIPLRYLACQGHVDLIPSSISNLWNLETFLFKGLGDEVVNISDSIWDMTKLRHVHIDNSASFDLAPYRLENSSMLDNLQTFSTPSLAYGDDMVKILGKIRGIRKLKCIFLDSWSDATNCNKFPELGFLNQLESLNVFYNGIMKYPCEFNLPSNLKKLTLSNFRMPWNQISYLATLCNLEVLKLLRNAFDGERWEMEDEVFPKLKFLKLDTLNVVEWRATDDNFPVLKCLLLHKCEQLEEIPPSIGDISTLQLIEVMWSSPSVAISAIKIHQEQMDFGNEGIEIRIHPKVGNLELSF